MMDKLITRFCIRHQFYLFAGYCSLLLLGLLAFGDGLYGLSYVTMDIVLAMAVSVITIFGFAHYLGRSNGKRAEVIISGLHNLSEGNLTHKIDVRGKDEFAWMCWEYTCTRKKFTEMVESLIGNAGQLAAAAEELSAITEQSSQGVVRQQSETEQVATAMNQMSVTVTEVAKNAANAATAALEADKQAKSGSQVVNDTVRTINDLAEEVQRTSDVIEDLKGDSLSIGTVLDVIRDIAEQTNLLALNAAIEAARAGEQGRGFAVVADEVRTLASRTQQSTQEINGMIEHLQNGANQAVQVMEQGRNK
ncbi:MAG: methyl-accepting chemotaxis protein, partial [Gammaproteobacteria bacterium]